MTMNTQDYRLRSASRRFDSGATLFLVSAAILCVGIASAQNDPTSTAEVVHVRQIEADDFVADFSADIAVLPIGIDKALSISTGDTRSTVVEVELPERRRDATPDPGLRVDDPINVTFAQGSESVQAFGAQSLGGKPGRVIANRFGIGKAAGVAIDPDDGGVFVLDSRNWRVSKIDSGRGQPTGQNPRITLQIQLAMTGLQQLKGLVYDPEHRALYTINVQSRDLYRIESDGSLVLIGRFPETHWAEPLSIMLSPSLDQTDDPNNMNLFMAIATEAGNEVHEWAFPRAGKGVP